MTQVIISRRELVPEYRFTGFPGQLSMLMGSYIAYYMKLTLLNFSKSQRSYPVKLWFQGFLQSLEHISMEVFYLFKCCSMYCLFCTVLRIVRV